MIKTLISSLRGCLVLLLYILNLSFWGITITLLSFIRVLLPWQAWRQVWYRVMHHLPEYWVSINAGIMRFFTPTRLVCDIDSHLNPKGWYLVLPNHQTWLDIIILGIVFNRKIPLLKFFMKKQLQWIPFVGNCSKALDFPLMGRYSKEYLKKHPEMKGKDMEMTRKACEKFKTIPTAIINFCEGTRFTEDKHRRQASPYHYLLKPKAGGIAFVLGAMGEYLHQILDVTLIYHPRGKTLWDFFCGKLKFIEVHVRLLPIQAELLGNYETDPKFRTSFQRWLNDLWAEKDALYAEFMKKHSN